MPRSKKLTEDKLLQLLTRLVRTGRANTPGIVIGAGDDAAVLRPPPDKELIVTSDILVEGRHFVRKQFTARELGYRAAAVNLSDIAAMCGRPLYGVVSLTLPRGISERYAGAIEIGIRDHLARYGASIVGGNISGSGDGLTIDVTLIGACERGKAWRRTCRPGRDAVVVAGYLGDAAAGRDVLASRPGATRASSLARAFKKPTPRLDVCELLHDERAVRGAIDVSDGMALDTIRLCRAGGGGLEIDATALPISSALQRYGRRERVDALRLALYGGEDYALVLAVAARSAEDVANRIERRLSVPARVVGRFTTAKGRYQWKDERGRARPLPARGWDHLR